MKWSGVEYSGAEALANLAIAPGARSEGRTSSAQRRPLQDVLNSRGDFVRRTTGVGSGGWRANVTRAFNWTVGAVQSDAVRWEYCRFVYAGGRPGGCYRHGRVLG